MPYPNYAAREPTLEERIAALEERFDVNASGDENGCGDAICALCYPESAAVAGGLDAVYTAQADLDTAITNLADAIAER